MNAFVATLMPYVERYGYWAVAGAVLPEGFGIPMPGETVLVGAAVLVARGDLSPAGVIGSAFTAAVIGNTLGYLLGYFGGRPAILRYGHRLFITPRRLAKTEAFFQRYGRLLVLVARFLDVFRQLNGIVAGLVHMPFGRFQAYNIAGAALWVGTWSAFAYALGGKGAETHRNLLVIKYIFCGAVAVFFIVLLVRMIRTSRRQGPEGTSHDRRKE